MARGILAHRIPRDTTNPIPTQFILTGLKIPITSQVDPHMTAEGMVINISAINPTNLRYTTQALHLLPIHLLQMLRGITKERHLLPGLTLLATISNRVQSINKISFNTQLRCPLCLRHGSRISEANHPQILHPFAPATHPYPQSRPLVPTVAPFQPSSTKKVQMTEKHNPLRSEHPSSQMPSLEEPVPTMRLSMDDFPALPKSQASAAPLKEKHAAKAMETPGQGKTVVISMSEGSNISLHSQATPAMDPGSRSIKPKQVGALSRVKTDTTSAQATTTANPQAFEAGPVSREGPIKPVSVAGDSALPAGLARPETGLSQRPASHGPVSDRTSTTSEGSNTGFTHSHDVLAPVRAPPGIKCSDEFMESEAEFMDPVTVDQVGRWTETRRREYIENWNTPKRGLQRDVEFCRMPPGTKFYGSESINASSSSLALDNEKEYNHILWNPRHWFWDTPSTFRMSPTHVIAADPQTQQLVSVFEIACKRLGSYIDGYSNFQKPSVLPPTGHRYVKGCTPRHHANWLDCRGIPDWNIAETFETTLAMCHTWDHRGPVIHDPIEIHVKPRYLPFSANPGSSAQIQRVMVSPSCHWDPVDYPAQTYYTAYSDMHNNEMIQQSTDSVENLASYYDFLEGASRTEPPRITIEAWEPDQTPRPSFASCVISPRSLRGRDCTDTITDSSTFIDSIPEERPPRPPHAAARGIALARYGTQAPDGSPSPLPRSRSRRRRG
ncbi:unnamed protein product [Penicillium manginii]